MKSRNFRLHIPRAGARRFLGDGFPQDIASRIKRKLVVEHVATGGYSDDSSLLQLRKRL
jgi:hypothetical protein